MEARFVRWIGLYTLFPQFQSSRSFLYVLFFAAFSDEGRNLKRAQSRFLVYKQESRIRKSRGQPPVRVPAVVDRPLDIQRGVGGGGMTVLGE